MDSLSSADMEGWTPIRVGTAGEPLVDWAIVDEPFTDPFFESTIERALRHPFNRVFARRTTLAALEMSSDRTGIIPTGFIFHMSRSGSTLISQMLAQLSETLVLSEPQPFDGLLRLHPRLAGSNELTGYLRGMVDAVVRTRPAAKRVFVKFHAWHALELPLIAEAFPDVPWIFVFREVRAVFRSQAQAPGAEVVGGLPNIGPPLTAHVEPDEYMARMLAAFCGAALDCAPIGRARFVEYVTLPEAVFTDVLPFFGVAATADETQRMREVAKLDPKSEGGAFRPAASAAPLSAESERLVATWLDPVYARLRARSVL